MSPKWFVLVIIILMLCASIAYGFFGDWRRCAYWALAAGLNVVVTW